MMMMPPQLIHVSFEDHKAKLETAGRHFSHTSNHFTSFYRVMNSRQLVKLNWILLHYYPQAELR